jgi:hypothetical protein
MIMPMVMSAIIEGEDWMSEMIERQAEDCGIEVKREQMYPWFGQKIQWGGIEASRLAYIFYCIVKAKQERM